MSAAYRGRFAPSPTGALHAGSLVAALGSWLDARAQGGRWLLRFEDVDGPRCVPGADRLILQQLAACGLLPDEAPQWQSQRSALYQASLSRLQADGWTYPCGCSRKDLAQLLGAQGQAPPRFAQAVYPGTCRQGLQGKPARAQRLRIDGAGQGPLLQWLDRRLGPQQQDLAAEVGDFVLLRADGLWAYQLAVVVDDAEQGITDVVRGEDLADNTARQIHLQHLLGLATPRYLHLPLVRGADGHKLSKQNGALALDTSQPLALLQDAAAALGLPPLPAQGTVADALALANRAWAQRWPLSPTSPPQPPAAMA